MKRKRGNKKSKRKGGTEVPGKEAVSLITEDNSGLEEFDNDDKYDSAMEVDTPSSTGTDHLNVANVNPDGSVDKAAGKSSVGRVKVKLRTSKMIDAQLNSSDALTQSDTDKSSLQMGLEKQSVVSEKMEDSANSLLEKETVVSGTASKKPGSIKIKSSKSLGAGNNLTSNALNAQGGTRMPQHDSRFNKKELDSALVVIKKVMKMDAAEPFNVPVNPVALGIPDYFDVIDTPMDFGTICSNLENGVKYMNSVDVFKDVQYIWQNCYKYNNKGDYILDLMRRVKKNFTKYWTAAGLYNGQVTATNGIDDYQENGGPSSQVKLSLKGQSKHKAKKRHGRRHKSDCLCAICVLKRRRKEREEIARISKDQQIGAGNNLAQEFKAEQSLRVESLGSDESSSNADDSVDNELDVEDERGDEVKMDVCKQQFSSPEAKQEEEKNGEGNEIEMLGGDEKGSEQSERLRGEEYSRSSRATMEQSGEGKMEDVVRHEEGGEEGIDEAEHKVVDDMTQVVDDKRKKKVKAWEELSGKNPMLLELCGVVFPMNPRSVWRGPHSLLPQCQTTRTSSIHVAIDKLMN